MPNTEMWSSTLEGRNATRAWRSAIYEAARNTIINPGLNKPNFSDASMGKRILFQFKSFTLASTTKTLIAGMQDARAGHMARVIGGSMSMLALGALSTYTRAMIIGGKNKTEMQNNLDGSEKATAWWADKAIDNSGLLGVLQFAYDAAVHKGKTIQSGNPFQDIAGPTAGLFIGQNAPMANIANSLRSLTPDKNNASSLRKMAPGQNLWFVNLLNNWTGAIDAIDKIGR